MKAQHVSSSTPLIIRSYKLYLQPLVYVRIWWPAVVKAEWEVEHPFPTQPWQRSVVTCVYKPEAVNTIYSSWWWAVCLSKHVEPSINFGIINSITKLHLVGISTVSTTMPGSMNIRHMVCFVQIWKYLFWKYFRKIRLHVSTIFYLCILYIYIYVTL